MILRETKQAPLTHEEMDSNFKSVMNLDNMFYAEERTTSNVASVSNTWTSRNLNTVVINNIPGVSLSNKEITIPSGKYWIEACALARQVDAHNIKVDTIIGLLGSAANSTNGASHTFLNGYLEKQNQSIIKLEHWANASHNIGFGWNTISGTPYNVTSFIKIWKIGE